MSKILSFVFILVTTLTAETWIDYDTVFQNGRITYYPQTGGGACMIPRSEWTKYTTALNEKNFEGGIAC